MISLLQKLVAWQGALNLLEQKTLSVMFLGLSCACGKPLRSFHKLLRWEMKKDFFSGRKELTLFCHNNQFVEVQKRE